MKLKQPQWSNAVRAAYALALAVALMSPAVASASSGFVSGRVLLYNSNGQYCPSSGDCTGSRYLWTRNSDQNPGWLEPFRNGQVVIRASSNFNQAILGQSVTDDNGNFQISWTWNGSPPKVKLAAFTIQGDDRFAVADMSGFSVQAATSFFNLTVGTTASSPQSMNLSVGSSSSGANWYFNVYWAAERVWRETFSGIGALAAPFPNGFWFVNIYGFSNTAFWNSMQSCPTSCTDAPNNRITIGTSDGLSPQTRVMHEMGHVVSYILHPFSAAGNTCYPNPGVPPPPGCAWAQGLREWGATGFEEAFATYGANVTLFGPTATTPTLCSTATTCYVPSTGILVDGDSDDLEKTDYPFSVNNCQNAAPTEENRWPLSHMRFQWDVYDSVSDADGDSAQEGVDCFWCPFANLYRYASGTGAWQIDEPWNSNYTSIDNNDGRGSSSYSHNYALQFRNIELLRTDNCNPP